MKARSLALAVLWVVSACVPVTEMEFTFDNDCDQEVNLDLKFQHDQDHDTQIWNNEVIGAHQRRDKVETLADLEVFDITCWLWFAGYDYRSDSRYQRQQGRISRISVLYSYQEQLDACTLLEQAY